MTETLIQTATLDDVRHVADNLRAEDYVELSLVQDDPPDIACVKAMTTAKWCKCMLMDGKPVVIFGVSASGKDKVGAPWMISTDDLYKISKQFVRASVREVDLMLKDFPLLCNIVHRDNLASQAWLRWLGFTILPDPMGPENQFYGFYKEAV